MENRKAKQKRTNIVICLILSFILALMFLPISTLSKNDYAFADSTYTTVLDDLSKDSAFSMDDYPTVEEDYSLQVVQIAESKDRELFVYVYQPSGTLQASSINISTKTGDELDYKNYNLSLLSASGSLFKYKVVAFVVSTEARRNYDISSIYRPFNEEIDTQPDNNNTITEIAYPVEKLYVLTTTLAGETIDCYDTETITIVNKYVGFCRYDESSYSMAGIGVRVGRYEPGFDSHFVAFSTDRQIDRLLEADVYYTSQHYYWEKQTTSFITMYETENPFGPIEDNTAELTYTSVGGGIGNGFRHYQWNRIQTVDEFLQTENRQYVYNYGLFNVTEETKITDEGLQDLQGMQWVLRFAETDYQDARFSQTATGPDLMHLQVKEHTIVGDVTILRLKFETAGAVYNLGVIDNKTTGDSNPINDVIKKIVPQIPDWLKPILYAILVVILIGIAIPFLPYIIHGLGFVLKYLLLGIWYVLKYTAIGIYWLFAWPFYLKKR